MVPSCIGFTVPRVRSPGHTSDTSPDVSVTHRWNGTSSGPEGPTPGSFRVSWQCHSPWTRAWMGSPSVGPGEKSPRDVYAARVGRVREGPAGVGLGHHPPLYSVHVGRNTSEHG